MKLIIETILRIVELVEAEGRAVREQVVLLGAALLVAVLAIILLLASLAALGVAAFLVLRERIGIEPALGLLGLAALAGAVICGMIGWRIVGGKQRRRTMDDMGPERL